MQRLMRSRNQKSRRIPAAFAAFRGQRSEPLGAAAITTIAAQWILDDRREPCGAVVAAAHTVTLGAIDRVEAGKDRK